MEEPLRKESVMPTMQQVRDWVSENANIIIVTSVVITAGAIVASVIHEGTRPTQDVAASRYPYSDREVRDYDALKAEVRAQAIEETLATRARARETLADLKK
jgi:hypothetical protein